jgi:hypothetical protein
MQTFLNAQNRLTDLRDEAIKLARPIFERLVVEFDKELHSVALHREEELSKMGVALFSDRWTDRGEVRDFALYGDPVVTGWQCRRSVRAMPRELGQRQFNWRNSIPLHTGRRRPVPMASLTPLA